MNNKIVILAVLVLVPLAGAQKQPTSPSLVFHNERLKTTTLENSPITGGNYIRLVSGFWVPESQDPSKALVFPQQIKITCTHRDKTCKEISITLAVGPG